MPLMMPLPPGHGPRIAFILSLDKIEPPVPIEHRPIKVFFTLTNYLDNDLTGTVSVASGGGGSYDIANLAAHGGTISDSINSIAPSAGKGNQILLQFFKLPLPVGAEFPPPDAEEKQLVDVAARYTVNLVSFDIGITRALHNDTDYVSLAAQLGDQPPLSTTRFMGDVNDGHHDVNLQLGPFDSVPGVSPNLTFSYLIMNKGHDDGNHLTAVQIHDMLSEAAKDILKVVYPQYSSLWDNIDQFTKYLNGLVGDLIFANCDGVVVADKVVASSTQLDQWTSTQDVYSPGRKDYPGTDSPIGCGRNSSYHVTWSVTRLLHD